MRSSKIPPVELDSIVMYYADTFGVDVNLIRAQIMQESSWDPQAWNPGRVTSDGTVSVTRLSVGLMQLTLPTGRQYLNNPNLTYGDLFQPDANVHAGVAYDAYLIQKYGNFEDALAAYNWGPGAFDKWMTAQTVVMMPQSTKDYVTNILRYYQEYAGRDIVERAQIQSVLPASTSADTVIDPTTGAPIDTSGGVIDESGGFGIATGLGTDVIIGGAVIGLVGYLALKKR